jgi:catechol-2,3-dioxygenase
VDLNHLHIHVRNRTISEKFYTDWLGMSVARKGECLTFMSDGAGFDLALMDDTHPQEMPKWFHFGCRLLSADAVIGLYARMAAAGIEMRKPLFQNNSLALFRCADPDGYALEIYWEAPGAPLD